MLEEKSSSLHPSSYHFIHLYTHVLEPESRCFVIQGQTDNSAKMIIKQIFIQVPMGLKTEEANCQSQFEAAVQVIQGLPKNGSYRPSYEEMLRFYGYYKQATMGQCQIPRPGFWDPIGRYKWDAWKRLGKMTKEEAMAAYIMEMKKAAQKVINTVPMDQASEDMFVYFEPLYEVIHDMPRPPESFFKKKSDSEIFSLQNSSLDGVAEIYRNPSIHEDCKLPGPGLANKVMKSSQVTNDSKNEVFCDSLEQVESHQARRLSAKQSFPLSNPPRSQTTEKTGSSTDLLAPSHLIHQQKAPPEINQSPETIGESQISVLTQKDMTLQVMSTIQALQQDMKKAMERLNYLESWAALQHPTSMLKSCLPSNVPDAKELPSWPVHLSPHTWFFLLAWPFVVQRLLWYFQRQKR